MAVLRFPPVEAADERGLLAVGGDLGVATLTLAYRSGVFPWPHPPLPDLLWFAPPRRAVLEFDDFKLSRRDLQYLKKSGFNFTVDQDLEAVIRACAKTPRPGQRGTWITEELIQAYLQFHRAGYAHSFEARSAEGGLVGGLYGVLMNRMFCGESMFHKVDHASKFALLKTIEHLRRRGLSWMDIQVMTPHMKKHGAREIPRAAFMKRLKQCL